MDQLTDPALFRRVYLLKGGPGCGKSALLQSVADAARKAGCPAELICSAADADTLDAVAVGGVSLIDASSPYAIEPRYGGAVETVVSLAPFCDSRLLRASREEIIALTDEKQQIARHACRFIAAAEALRADTWRLALEAADTSKIERLADRIAAKELRGAKSGRESLRFLSARTAKGEILLGQTAALLAERVYVLEDDLGPCAATLLCALRRTVRARGLECITCLDPLCAHEQPEHLFIPSLSLGFVTKNERLTHWPLAYRVINARRFTNREALAARKKHISLNRKAQRRMLLHAQELMADAMRAHDQLRALYLPAMDFSPVDCLTQKLIGELFL